MKQMKRFLVIPNEHKDPDYLVTKRVVSHLTSAGGEVYFEENHPAASKVTGCALCTDIATVDAMIVIGGDGSVLDASVTAMKYDLPLLGINLGRLGYLAEIEIDNLPLIERLTAGDYVMQSRMTLSLSCTNGEAVTCGRSALNEISILHGEYARIADLTMTDTMGNHIRYRGDGLLISTPSGSTAYAFSAGGPVIDPALDAICVTPVCPHSFFNRSMVLGPHTQITVQNTTGTESVCFSADGRDTQMLPPGGKITIAIGQKRLQMISFGGIPTFTTLRRKMELAELKD